MVGVLAGVALFAAWIVGVVFAVGRWVVRSRHEIPFGPYLAIASLGMVVAWNGFYDWVWPALEGLGVVLGRWGRLLGL